MFQSSTIQKWLSCVNLHTQPARRRASRVNSRPQAIEHLEDRMLLSFIDSLVRFVVQNAPQTPNWVAIESAPFPNSNPVASAGSQGLGTTGPVAIKVNPDFVRTDPQRAGRPGAANDDVFVHTHQPQGGHGQQGSQTPAGQSTNFAKIPFQYNISPSYGNPLTSPIPQTTSPGSSSGIETEPPKPAGEVYQRSSGEECDDGNTANGNPADDPAAQGTRPYIPIHVAPLGEPAPSVVEPNPGSEAQVFLSFGPLGNANGAGPAGMFAGGTVGCADPAGIFFAPLLPIVPNFSFLSSGFQGGVSIATGDYESGDRIDINPIPPAGSNQLPRVPNGTTLPPGGLLGGNTFGGGVQLPTGDFNGERMSDIPIVR